MAMDKNTIRKPPSMQKGTIIMWNDSKGFGFIRSEKNEEDFFVHISNFKKGTSRRPEIGDVVNFRPDKNAEKKRVSFALFEMTEQDIATKGFELNPKERSWAVNLLIFTPLLLSGYLILLQRNPIPFFSYWILSLLTMILYGADKAHAATHKWRIPEIYLHILEIMGGWPGALMAQNDFRHKTRKSAYLYILRAIITLHILAWIGYFYWLYAYTG
jgi:uncharacterized membrane protein YsdA (DUF1294 family)/cold shock CspA family protein